MHRIPGIFAGLSLFAALAISAGPPRTAAKPLATFTISEEFGISHPLQVVDFDVPAAIDATNAHVIGPEGKPVAFQRLANGNIAVETDLPARASRTWGLVSGTAPEPVPPHVRVITRPKWIEVTNGLTGVRIPLAQGQGPALAPIQGIELADGRWSAAGPNYLEVSGNKVRPQALEARTATTKLTESGPLRARIEVDYTFERPALLYGGRTLIESGRGYFRSVITLDADSPSILIEDDTDMDLQYRLDFYKEVQPDRGRYRGHHATSAAFGREPNGGVYRSYDNRPPIDAERDFDYRVPTWSAYITGDYSGYSLLARLGLWNPWVFDSGWYWMMYSHAADGNAPVIGIFPGAASRLMGAGDSGPGLMFLPAGGSSDRVAAVCFQSNRRTPNGTVFPRVRVPWAIFAGAKSTALLDATKVQPIAREMNLRSGINLNKVYRYRLAWPDPAGGVQPLYSTKAQLLRLVNRVRDSPAFFRRVYDAEPGARALYDLWRNPTDEKRNAQAARIVAVAHDWVNAEVNGDGIYDRRFAYWHGGLEADTAAPIANEMLSIEPLAPALRERLKSAIALFGYLLWDDDLAPLSGNAGVNLGTPNMPVQQAQYRELYALMLAGHPEFAERAREVPGRLAKFFEAEINGAGAHRASPHYADASMEPLLDSAQQAYLAGLGNVFESEPAISSFARFYMQMLTPPEVRFGGMRKLVSIGDGSTESTPLFGELATYLAPDDPELSSELMAAWRASGSAHSAFHGSTMLKIDEGLPTSELKLASSNWPGWCSVLRSAVGTAKESAVWFVNGDFYRDHYHEDKGSVTFYALGAPVAIDWGSMYSPRTAGPYMHSVVLPESAVGGRWDAEVNPEFKASPWIRSTQDGFAGFDDAAWSSATFDAANGSNWSRTVALVHADEQQPLIFIKDSISGPYGAEPRISTLNMMARGEAGTPSGPASPGPRAFALQPGLNTFHFTGRFGVDWDVYTDTSEPQQFLIGSWGHAWHPSAEMAQFERVNKRPFREDQYIFRLRGSGPVRMVVAPRRPGTAGPAIHADGAAFRYRTAAGEGIIGDAFHAWRSATQTTVAAFSSAPASAYGIAVGGGPAEAALEDHRALLTITGPKGSREFQLPGTWETKTAGVRIRRGVVSVDFDGLQPMRISLKRTD